MIPTLTEALARLEANPAVAAEYDAAMRREAPGKSRREAVQATLDAFAAKRRENEAMRAKLIAARQKIAALEKAKAALPQRKAFAATKPAPKPTAKPSATIAKPASKAPAPLSERDKLKAQYAAITDAAQKRTFRLRWWNQLAGKIVAPEPRKSNK